MADISKIVLPNESQYDLKDANAARKHNPEFTGSISLNRTENTTVGTNSTALGYNVTASGLHSHAEGSLTIASNDQAHAEGYNTTASGVQSHAEGNGTTASASYAHAEGYGASGKGALGVADHAEGYQTKADSGSTTGKYGAHAEGLSTVASESGAHAEGIITIASGEGSHAEGNNTNASGTASHTEGNSTLASGSYSHAEGQYSRSTGMCAHSEGYGGSYNDNGTTKYYEAVGMADHVEGYQTMTASSQPGNHAEGYLTKATGGAAHSEGAYTVASGNSSHAEGMYTTASGSRCHAEGYHSTASGSDSHAEGIYTTASGYVSHAEGSDSIASGSYSHAEGCQTVARGACSHVSGVYNVEDGYTNWTAWAPNTSYSVGDKRKRTVNNVTTGYICKTAHTSGSTFIDTNWNVDTQINYAEIVGNGTANSRANIRALDWEGNQYLKGDVYVGCNNDSTGGTKVAKLTDIPSVSGFVSGPSGSTSGHIATFNGTDGKTIQDSGFTIATSVPENAVFTDTTYESKTAASGGTDVSLVTTGEKYTWNNKYTKPSGGIPSTDIASGVIPDISGKLDVPATPGTSGQVLTSDGSGGQSWQTPNYLPAAPVSDGTYYLQATVSSGTVTYSWVTIPNANGVSF